MAEDVVDFVWKKLGDALTGVIKDALLQEGLALYSVNDKAEAVQRELGRIKSFLRDADSKSSGGGSGEERVRNWVKEVRNVAYSIEDAVDTFQAEVDWINYKEQGFINWIQRCFKKPMLLPALHTLGSEMDDAQARIKEISESRLAMGVNILDDAGNLGRSRHPIRQLIDPELMEMEVVGFDSDKVTIIDRLLDEHNSRRSVVSIVGPGGIGKTTLAQRVFVDDDVKKRFEVRIWLSVSEEYNMIELLKKMHQKLQLVNQRDYHELNEDNLMREIHASLKEKRYLIVMDDIWTDEVWYELQPTFPDVHNGSRILITSRFINIAKAADPGSEPHELQYLNEEQSVKLLLQKAFPIRDPNEAYPQDLLELAREFARKCSGLPLQLVVLGGLLSKKSPDYSTWHRFMQTMDWVTDGKSTCFDVVATSYKNLPLHLKSCFMSFSCFPEDYEIDARSLISYWSIEGFIPQDGRGTMDDKAQGYLEDLVQRCMVQVTAKTSTGIIEKCRVHTLLRDVAVYEAKERNFITIFWKQEDYQEKEITARHASFQFYNTPEAEMQSNSTENKDVIEYTGPNVRSLMFFGKILPIHSRMKLLKVLIAYRTKVTFYYGKRHTWLEKLISLRHLEFRECELENDTLPEKINRLHCLQYLDLTDTKIVNLPKSIESNKALRLVVNRVKSES